MIVHILKQYDGLRPGQIVDVTREYARQLISWQVAIAADNQERFDIVKKKVEETEPKEIIVNNYYVAPEARKSKKRRSNIRR